MISVFALDIFNSNCFPPRLSRRESVWAPARFPTASFPNGSKRRSHPCPRRSHRSWDRNSLCFSSERSAVINKVPFVWEVDAEGSAAEMAPHTWLQRSERHNEETAIDFVHSLPTDTNIE